MHQTLLTIRLFFFILCIVGGWVVTFAIPEWESYRWTATFIGGCLGALVILTDILLKGFSLRGLSALTFGLFIGWAIAQFISASPLFDAPFEDWDETSTLLARNMYLIRLALFIVLMYLGAVIALRGKDEFNLVIPYVRFVPHGVDAPIAIVDTSALIDGRLAAICESRFMGHALVIPQFVIDELQAIADSPHPDRQARGRRGIDCLNRLRAIPDLDLRISESTVDHREKVDAKLVFLAESMKAKLLTTDYNLAKVAEFHNITWLNLNTLAKALSPELLVGDSLTVQLVKPGKDGRQAIGYLSDGSMVVVGDAKHRIGDTVEVTIDSIIPSTGGKMIFASLISPTAIVNPA